MVADWCILAAQQRQPAYAVHAFVSCQLCAQHFGERRKQVGMVDEVIATAPWRHLARPTHDQWHAVPALPGIRLVAAKRATRTVTVLFELLHTNEGRAAIVAAEQHECVFGRAALS